MKLWGTIEKVTENEDGTLTVAGIASSEAVDSDGEIITSAAMKDAIPDYMKFGALREMHQPIAAGSALSCEVQEDGRTYLEALVVDSESVKKVKAGVLKGFSIGGKVQKRNPKNRNIIEAIKLVEISLVDRPANPEAIIGLVKMEDAVDETTETPAPAPENQPDPQPAPAVDTEKAERLEALKKWAGESITDAAVAIQALDALFYILCKEMGEDEASAEQVAALTAAVEALKAFISSEIKEPTTPPAAETVALAEETGDLGKKMSGAQRSAMKEHHDQLTALHKAMGDCMGKMAGVWKDDDVADADKADTSGALAKAAGLEEELTKMEAARDEAMAKADKLQKELDALKAEKPLKAVPIEKGAEANLTKSKETEAEAAPTDPLEAMKKVQKTGGRLITTTNRLG